MVPLRRLQGWQPIIPRGDGRKSEIDYLQKEC